MEQKTSLCVCVVMGRHVGVPLPGELMHWCPARDLQSCWSSAGLAGGNLGQVV